MDHDAYMREAISAARNAPEAPFGSVLVRRSTGEVVATGWNRTSRDPTLHGEIDAIQRCAASRPEIDWAQLDLYTTAEPCPMCQGAIEWAGIGAVYYGTSIPTLRRYGWRQIDIRAEEVARRTPFHETRVVGGVLESECDRLFAAARATA